MSTGADKVAYVGVESTARFSQQQDGLQSMKVTVSKPAVKVIRTDATLDSGMEE